MIGEEKGSVAISGRSSHKMTGLVGRQLVLEGSLFNIDIFFEFYFLFEVILYLKHFFVKGKIQNLAIHLQKGLCYRNLSF